ncbi:MAG: cupin domain-containing protein [Proteobacteria bacterium]|nr:cupin domain-containing protein [Pseudomonadota bacterium]MBI3499750.1 cupin domain-containing protein [Pseudomonadota bacterium]
MPKPRTKLSLPALDPSSIVPRRGSGYPKPYRDPCMARAKRTLGDAVGLQAFGVNLVELEPGAWSSQRHWHTREDEFVYVLEGELTLVSEAGKQVLKPGMAAGFPAGKADGHHFINRGRKTAVYLEVGNREAGDACHYSDVDLHLPPAKVSSHFTRKNGKKY